MLSTTSHASFFMRFGETELGKIPHTDISLNAVAFARCRQNNSLNQTVLTLQVSNRAVANQVFTDSP